MNGKCRRGRRRSQGDTSPESRAHSRRRSVRQLACKWGDPAAAGRAPGFQLPAFVFDLPASVLGCPTSVLGCPTSVLGCPISVLGCPISVLGCPISFSDGPTSALGCPASVVNPPPFPQNPPTSDSQLPISRAGAPCSGAQAAHFFLRDPLFWRRAPSSGCGAAKSVDTAPAGWIFGAIPTPSARYRVPPGPLSAQSLRLWGSPPPPACPWAGSRLSVADLGATMLG